MARFVVRKNTLPFVHQWAVVDTNNNCSVGEYRTKDNANIACDNFNTNGLPRDHPGSTKEPKNAWDAIRQRMNKPDGDPPVPPVEKSKHSSKRRIELD